MSSSPKTGLVAWFEKVRMAGFESGDATSKGFDIEWKSLGKPIVAADGGSGSSRIENDICPPSCCRDQALGTWI